MSAILKVDNLSYNYDGNASRTANALKNVDFEVQAGEIVGIIGHTGSGKSTLVQQLNGLLKPTSGQVLLSGKDIWEKPKEIRKIRSQVGLVFQYPEYQLFEETVYADIAFGPKNMGLSGGELDHRVREICDLVGVPESFFERSPLDLSGGEKRRVAIAGVMAMQPKIIVFDEPFAGLDPIGRSQVLKMIQDYRAAYHATVLIVSHGMEDLAVLCDRILVLNDGELVLFDTVKKVFTQAELLRSIGLEIPIIARVFEEMRERGTEVPEDIFSVQDAVSFLNSFKQGGGARA
ncbi:MAG: energy-coupling factor transporter ATPase [Clostridia bacterium]|nr:energy-coupling factor transporter ATPase [Clostridia bacterium]